MLDLILCIDDDPITLMLIKKNVQKVNFSKEIVTAENGEEALDFFNSLSDLQSHDKANKQPQLIFLDLNMPIMGGWEFLDCFNNEEYSNFNHTKIVVLSSTIDPNDIEKSKSYPMVIDFFPKPITTEMLFYLKTKI